MVIAGWFPLRGGSLNWLTKRPAKAAGFFYLNFFKMLTIVCCENKILCLSLYCNIKKQYIMNDLRLITTYAVDIDLVGGDQIREFETQNIDSAKEYFDELSKDMKYEGMEIYNIQLVAVNGFATQYLDYVVIESKFNEWYEFEDEPRYVCQNCGGGFLAEEMDFDVEDVDLCKNCNHKSFNDSPYGENN